MIPARNAFPRRAACLLVSSLMAVAAVAQGWVIIDPPGQRVPPSHGPMLQLKNLRVSAEIIDGAAVTDVEQSFQNPVPEQIEGAYYLPLPDNVAVGDFSMTVGGKTLRGEVLDADTARQTYEEIVRRMRDPGLLEYMATRLFRARIFPIPPNGTVEVRLRYSQAIEEQGGLGLFRHPLRCETLNMAPIERISLSASLRSKLPLAAVFSPSHRCEVSRPNAYQALIAYEAVNLVPDRDFLVYYQRRDADFGLVLLTHRASGEAGTFMLRVTPRVDLADRSALPKDIAFVIDTSGSMQGAKIEQTRRALKFCIGSLRPQDRFNIYAFSTGVHPFRQQLVPADEENRQAARKFADDLQATGGTNINAALLAALADDPRDTQRLYLIVFMTDGLPTVEVTDPEQIRRNVLIARQRPQVRLHVLGVGSDVNTYLLDKLAEDTRGSRDYCTENEDLELKLSALVRRLSYPVLTDLRLHVEGVRTCDLYPDELPDLFCGDDLVVLGRYEGSGSAMVRLEGRMAERTHTLSQTADFPAVETSNDFLPRLWANRKVAYLLDQIRLHGEKKELRDEIISLAKRYGIVTPYTAALIIEEDAARPTAPDVVLRPLAERARARAGGSGLVPGALGAHTGGAAVRSSADLQSDKLATALPDDIAAEPDRSDTKLLRHVGDKTFVFAGGRWTDTSWDGQRQPKKVTAFGDEYFKLLAERPELRKYFALGERVLVVVGDEVYESN